MKKHSIIVLVTVLFILVVQIAVGISVYNLLPNWPTRGQFGDIFGLANSLFSGLAFAGVIYAILLQREDLALQRKELELTRKELKRSASAQEQSEVALKAQAAAASQSAKLAAINFLLGHCKSEIAHLRLLSYTSNDPRALRMRELLSREIELVEMLDRLFDEISRTENSNDEIQDR